MMVVMVPLRFLVNDDFWGGCGRDSYVMSCRVLFAVAVH
jgi:hypothetical protein